MRELFEAAILKPGWIEREKENVSIDPGLAGAAFFCDDPGIFMSYWYGGLYVVIEGWRAIKLDDPVINDLLNDPKVDLLRLYRNGAFHFQKDYCDHRFQGFMSDKDAANWVKKLNTEYGRWFIANSKKNQKP